MRSRFLAAAILTFAAWGCGGSGGGYSSSSPRAPTPTTSTPTSSTPAGAVTVNITGQKADQSFSPNPVPMNQGGLVVWHNSDNAVHHIVMNDGSFDSGDLGPGATSAAMTLSGGGGQYHCTIHPTTMFGSVNIATSGPGMPGASPY